MADENDPTAADIDELTAFLYRLMRDHLPPGVVAKIIDELNHVDAHTYAAVELEALARRYAARILPALAPAEQSAGAKAWLARAPERVLEELNRADRGLTLDELATVVGWASNAQDTAECEEIVQRLYDAGAVQRDSGADGRAKILITADGQMLLSQVRETGATI